jgi:hypothetical protein
VERWNSELANILARWLASAVLRLAAAMMTRTRIIQRCIRLKFSHFRFISAGLFFSCCGSVAAPGQRPENYDQVSGENNERRRGHRPRRTRIIQCSTRVKFSFSAAHQQSVSSPAATASRRRGNGLGTAIKHLRKTASGAAGIGLGITITYPRRTTGAAAGNGLGTTPNYLRGAAGNGRAQR